MLYNRKSQRIKDTLGIFNMVYNYQYFGNFLPKDLST